MRIADFGMEVVSQINKHIFDKEENIRYCKRTFCNVL